METNVEVIEKLKKIFDSFLDANFVTTNSVYFEKLLTHLGAKENAFILQENFALEWVQKSLTIIGENFGKLNPKVISFMLHFCGLLAMDKWIIVQLKEQKIIDRIVFIIERDVHKFNPSMKLGSIRLFAAVSRYSLGLAYIRHTKTWRFLIEYCNKDHTLYVVREARQLLYELLYMLSVKMNNEETCLEILSEIFKPIHENVFEESPDTMTINVDDSELQQKISPALDLISFIFQKTLESEEKTNIVQLCIVHHHMPRSIWKISEMTQNQFFIEKMVNALASYNFAKLVYEKCSSGQIAAEDFNEFGVFFFNLMKFCVSRRECVNFLKLAELNHILWKKLGQRAPKEVQIEDVRVQFENQLITFHLLPVLSILKSKEHHKEELFDNYIVKLFEISCDHTLRICYAFRDILLNLPVSAAHLHADLAYKSIHGILSMENILEREQAVLVFQAMIYVLKEFTMIPKEENNTISKDGNVNNAKDTGLVAEIPNVVYAALVGLQTLIYRYKITWKESIETICVVFFASELLDNPNLSTRLAVQSLKLAQLSIEHFLSPNMALLVDNLQGSGLLRLGPIMVKRFHDTSWEVRDSALELATSIAIISRIKYPAFQQFIVDNNICPIVYEMAKNDCEPYVRASAFKCISKIIPINLIWESGLDKLDLLEYLFFVLYNESEGIVRKEAVSALISVYDHRKIPANYMNTLYSTFCHSGVADLHWEVKVTALYFWELVIQKQFTDQGMIDGTFPTVTFSKANKKIVTLNEKEITLRIRKVFIELAQIGCLGVILKSLNDDCDLEVIKASVFLVKRLLEILKKYDYVSIIEGIDNNACSYDQPAVATKAATNSNNVLPTTESVVTDLVHSDDVIESILASQDINLLVAAYEKQLQMNENETTVCIDNHFYKDFARVSAKEFVTTIKSIDLDELLQNHNKWLLCVESFSSLLDDLLCAINPDEAMTADCY